MRVTRSTKPKQTETTQRWKIALEGSGHGVLHTKIELSRRGNADEHVLEPVLAEKLPELELSRRFRIAEARRWIARIPARYRRTMVTRRLEDLLAHASQARSSSGGWAPRHRRR